MREIKHILRTQDFDREFLERLFSIAETKGDRTCKLLEGKDMVCLFYQASTRTRLSFDRAMKRLGGGVMSMDNAEQFSSAAKGETLEDAIHVISGYCEVIVLRHPEKDAAERAAAVSLVPVINAGCGDGQHPSQTVLDLFTINQRHGSLDNLTIALSGDLLGGRTVHSMIYLLGKFEPSHLILVSPERLRVGRELTDYLARHGVQFHETTELASVIHDVDVLYQTRVQREYYRDMADGEFAELQAHYLLDRQIAERMKPGAIIMHPLPRNSEISTNVDDLPQAIYFQQAHWGVPVRMALLQMLLAN